MSLTTVIDSQLPSMWWPLALCRAAGTRLLRVRCTVVAQCMMCFTVHAAPDDDDSIFSDGPPVLIDVGGSKFKTSLATLTSGALVEVVMWM